LDLRVIRDPLECQDQRGLRELREEGDPLDLLENLEKKER